jgi:hypothetical protein
MSSTTCLHTALANVPVFLPLRQFRVAANLPSLVHCTHLIWAIISLTRPPSGVCRCILSFAFSSSMFDLPAHSDEVTVAVPSGVIRIEDFPHDGHCRNPLFKNLEAMYTLPQTGH